jgi:hypothetical protein
LPQAQPFNELDASARAASASISSIAAASASVANDLTHSFENTFGSGIPGCDDS